MRALMSCTASFSILVAACAVEPTPPVEIDESAAAAAGSSPITCSQSGSTVVVSNGRYRATLSTGKPLVVDELVGGRPGERLVSRDRLVVDKAGLVEPSISLDRCRSYHARVSIHGNHPSLPLHVRRTFEFTRSMNVFETIELLPGGAGAVAPISWAVDTVGNGRVIAYASTKDLLVEDPMGPLGGMDDELLGWESASTPVASGALGWTRSMSANIPPRNTFLANQVLQLDGSPTNRLDFGLYQYLVHPFYSGLGLRTGEGSAPGTFRFIDFNAYKYAMEDLGPVPAGPGSGLAEDTLIRLGVHLQERLLQDGGWFRYPAWSIYPDGDSFTTNGRCLPVLAYLWAHLAVTDSGTSFVHHPGDHDEIYDRLQDTFRFLDEGAAEPTFADRLGGNGLTYLSYSLHLKEKLGNFGGAVINSHSEALHFISIMIEASQLRGRAADRVGWETLLDVYFPGTRSLFGDLYPGHQDGQVYPGLIDYATNQRNIYNVDPGVPYPSITFQSLAAPYLMRGEYEIEFADVVERYARGDTSPFDEEFEPAEQAPLVGALWRAFPPSLALSFSDESPPRHFTGERWDTWTMHPRVQVLGGDFNGDDRADVLKLDVREDGGQSPAGNVYVALAQAGGGFATGGPWATWTTYADMKVVTGDFDGDGKTDLMKLDYPLGGGNGLGGLWVGLSTGSGFTSQHWGDWQTNSRSRLLAGDFNCDGLTDVMMVEVAADGTQIPDGELRVGLSTGSSFDTSQPPWALWTTHGKIVVMAGDFDGDHCEDVMKVDVATDGSAGSSGLWVGLSRRRLVGSPPREVWSFDTGAPWATWFTHDAIPFRTGDFNGDGKTDVLKVDNDRANPATGGVWVGLSTGAGFATRQWASWYTHERIDVLTGDFDGNGKSDVMKLDVAPDGSTARGGLWVGLSDGHDFTTREWARWDTYDSMKV
ncbi:MAG TPA: VCBS repeat-containing protein, partial [Kofleriaceae bacterium]|nr:VCBS repeat-containing protein [Kofleriaceae bacterium]